MNCTYMNILMENDYLYTILFKVIMTRIYYEDFFSVITYLFFKGPMCFSSACDVAYPCKQKRKTLFDFNRI